jgi:hypothetical protein
LQRSLLAVFRFYDAFFYPPDDLTPPITSPLKVSIPQLRWGSLRSEDFTYRFSALTLTQVAPKGANLKVQVVATQGDYVSHEDILLTLPLPIPTPPKRTDFLLPTRLWPTVALRPPDGETAVRGRIVGGPTLPVDDIKVEMWTGTAPTPPAGTPFTRTNGAGDFLFRFPLLKGATGTAVPIRIRLKDGTIGVSPGSLSQSMTLGRTQILQFQRT